MKKKNLKQLDVTTIVDVLQRLRDSPSDFLTSGYIERISLTYVNIVFPSSEKVY